MPVFHRLHTVLLLYRDITLKSGPDLGPSSHDLYAKAQKERLDNLDQANQEIDRLRKTIEKLQSELQGMCATPLSFPHICHVFSHSYSVYTISQWWGIFTRHKHPAISYLWIRDLMSLDNQAEVWRRTIVRIKSVHQS